MVCNILIKENKWSAYDIRKADHISYNQRQQIINQYISKNKLKITKYINMRKINITDKKWWINNDNDENNSNNINNNNNLYLTYQKQLINTKSINKLIHKYNQQLPHQLQYKYNIYYRYQPTVLQIINNKKVG